MEKIELEVETVTPLFIAGADTGYIVNEGLRPPSMKGLMRWWFRAILGGMVPIDSLRKKENEIFGSTEQKSKVKILSSTNTKPMECEDLGNVGFPKYLWFPLEPSKREKRYYYPAESKFKIFLYLRESKSFHIALGALWALIYLGGIGSRSRRGAGSLRVNNSSENSPYVFVFDGKTLPEAKEFIEYNLSVLFEEFKKLADKDFHLQENVEFPVLSKRKSKIGLIRPFKNWNESLKDVERIYKNFREDKEILEKINFGLPININVEGGDLENIKKNLRKKLSEKETEERMKLIEEQLKLRYASPFCI
jgi:CRISPR-associated protein Cmr1